MVASFRRILGCLDKLAVISIEARGLRSGESRLAKGQLAAPLLD